MIIVEIMVGRIVEAAILGRVAAVIVTDIMIRRIVGAIVIAIAGMAGTRIVVIGIPVPGIVVARPATISTAAMATALIRKSEPRHRPGSEGRRRGHQSECGQGTEADAPQGGCIAFLDYHWCAPRL
jgi:hypothetical protein